MKKILISALLIAGSFGFANAQAKHKVVAQKPAHTSTTLKAAPNASAITPVAKVKSHSAVTAHVKANGTADKRFKENKASTKPATASLKKDGTADMRHKANRKK